MEERIKQKRSMFEKKQRRRLEEQEREEHEKNEKKKGKKLIGKADNLKCITVFNIGGVI